jgi:hypothetical protein
LGAFIIPGVLASVLYPCVHMLSYRGLCWLFVSDGL